MPWVKGQSGNPTGRARSSVRQALREIAALEAPEKQHSYAWEWALQLATKAASGDLEALKAVFDQIDGKPIQVTDNTNRNASLDDVLEALREVPDNVRPMPRAAGE